MNAIRRFFGGSILLLVGILFFAMIADVVRGRLGAGELVILLIFFALFGALGVFLVRGRRAETQVTMLMEDGSVHTLDRGFVPGPAPIGSVVPMDQMRAVVPAHMPSGDSKRALESGDARLAARDWPGAIAAYRTAMAQFPAVAPFALGNVGACLFMLGRYDEAIEQYQRAISAGANPIAMNDNIREAQEAKARPRS